MKKENKASPNANGASLLIWAACLLSAVCRNRTHWRQAIGFAAPPPAQINSTKKAFLFPCSDLLAPRLGCRGFSLLIPQTFLLHAMHPFFRRSRMQFPMNNSAHP